MSHRQRAETGLSVNEIVRQHGQAYGANHRLTAGQRRVLQDLRDCQTGALGGHIEQCERCQTVHYWDHSCRNRHCPQCGGEQRAAWLLARSRELLPVPYFHAVFTIDHSWNGLLLGNQAVGYELLCATASQLLKEYAQRYLGGESGFLTVLHTWGQQMDYHVHLHCIVMGGAVQADGRFVRSRGDFLLPVLALAADFRERFCAGLQQLYEQGQLRLGGVWAEEGYFARQLASSQAKQWEVYLKPPFGQPERVLEYLSGYVNRIAISNRRLVAVNDEQVTFTYRDYRAGREVKPLTLTVDEFLRRFLLHVLPAGFVRVRYYGLWHPSQRQRRDACRRQLLAALPGIDPASLALFRRLWSPTERWRCPTCGEGQLMRIGAYAGSRRQLPQRRCLRPPLRREQAQTLTHCLGDQSAR